MPYIQKITNTILAHKLRQHNEVIAVCGAADLGKSYLANELVKSIKARKLTADYLTLDSFMMSREERIRKGISGYDPCAYEFNSVILQLEKFKEGKDLSFRAYDHSTGKRVDELTTIKACDILILDGLHSLHEILAPYVSHSLFVYTQDSLLRKIRRKADLEKRKQTVEVSEQIEPKEFEKYKQLVEPYKKQATWQLFLVEKWKFCFQENKQ